MPEESTTPDLVELTRQSIEATSLRDVDRSLGFIAPDAVWETEGLGTFAGKAAIRGFTADSFGAFAEFEMDAEEIVDLGGGVVLTVIVLLGRPRDADGDIQMRYASAAEWEGREIVRITNYLDVDEGRAAAERLAEERG